MNSLSLSSIVDVMTPSKEKKDMRQARVFYVNVYDVRPDGVQKVLESFVNSLKTSLDVSNVIFVPVRDKESGWQFPQ